ncbi:hypothetical protein [Streptomyces sp. NPDC054784]
MRSRMIATAAVAAAFVVLPAGSAFAGSGPVAPPSERTAAGSTAPSPEGNPLSAKAKAAEVCDDARQIGTTGYVKQGGETIASVKQFYSAECKENYSYVWLWDSFVDKQDDYDVTASVYSYSQDKQLGTVTWPVDNGQEYWSEGAATASECTAAVGTVRPVGTASPLTGQSDKRC